MSVGLLIAVVVFLVALLAAIGILALPAHLIIWLIAGLALAVILGGWALPFALPHR